MASSKPNQQLPQIVLFGDSLTEWSFDESTQGFGWYLANWYRGKAEIINEGYAGYTSEHVKPEFARLLSKLTRPFAPQTYLITIFLGANDACFVGESEYCPFPRFTDNLRGFVEDVLIEDSLADANIVLITPPPVNVPEPLSSNDEEDLGPAMAAALKGRDPKMDRGYRTYMSKKRYADGVMAVASEYAETGRVVGLDFWQALVEAGMEEQGRKDEADDEDKFPGCGLPGAKEFRKGWFTDGLHLDKKAYNVLSKVLVETVTGKWPKLLPDRIGV